MAEYWKSLPRKFCDVCKCWFADNKASIDFHERGKRHQENAQKRIQDIQKRGIKEFKKQQELENEMEKIERAALAAYEKDLKNIQGGDKPQSKVQISNQYSSSSSISNVKPKSSNHNVQKKSKPNVTAKPKKDVPEPIEPVNQKIWYEAMTDEGYKYYWNAETSESRWEPPEEGYISIEEQSQENSEIATEEQQQKSSEEKSSEEESSEEESEEETKSTAKKDETDSSENIICSIGPQPKIDPYGQWVTVEKEEPVEYDLQLPAPSENAVEIVIPLHRDEPKLKFKEKIIGQLSDTDSGDVTFKKRKFAGSFKRNARQRTIDDD